MAEDELDLTQLETSELIEQIQEDLYGALTEEVEQGVHELLRREITPYDVLT